MVRELARRVIDLAILALFLVRAALAFSEFRVYRLEFLAPLKQRYVQVFVNIAARRLIPHLN